MIELDIIMTGKGYSPKSEWRQFAHERKTFADMQDVNRFLNDRYGKAKRRPMYVDMKDGRAVRCGWVIGFHASDISHVPVEKWIQQDWVHVRECKTVDLDARK
jgi:hypothetical protein